MTEELFDTAKSISAISGNNKPLLITKANFNNLQNLELKYNKLPSDFCRFRIEIKILRK